MLRTILIALAMMAAFASGFARFGLAQDAPVDDVTIEGDAPQAASGTDAQRLVFVLFDQMSYKVHPFQQITNDSDFKDGRAPLGSSIEAGVQPSDEKADIFQQFIHALPPFGYDYVRPVDLPFPRGVGFSFDHFVFSQTDKNAVRGSASIPPIKMDTYLYQGGLKFFAFDPSQPGLNYFFGIGLGALFGKMTADPYVDKDPVVVQFSQTPIGSTRMGLESKGDNFGFRYELLVLAADETHLRRNPYPDQETTHLDFSGSIIRIALFWEFN